MSKRAENDRVSVENATPRLNIEIPPRNLPPSREAPARFSLHACLLAQLRTWGIVLCRGT